MFGFLKKKLKENIDKITRKVEKRADEEEPEKIKVSLAPDKTLKPKESGKPEKKPKRLRLKKKPIEEVDASQLKSVEAEEREEKAARKEKRAEKKAGQKPKKKISLFGKRIIEEKDLKEMLWNLQVSLLESDVALETAEKICNDLKESLVGEEVKKSEIGVLVRENIKKSLFEILDQEPVDLVKKTLEKSPYLVLFLGFNGSGKTTAIARIAYLLKENGLKVNMAAGDTWRAAAINQLEKHGEKLKVPVVKHDYGADSAAVIYDAMEHAKARELDVVLADTAGRTHTNVNLMNELNKIIKVNKPDLKILVIDSLTGNDAVEQARAFDESVGVDGIILTKMDVNEKGGAALSVAHTIGKPILYIGTGQEYGNLEEFNPRKIIQNLLD